MTSASYDDGGPASVLSENLDSKLALKLCCPAPSGAFAASFPTDETAESFAALHRAQSPEEAQALRDRLLLRHMPLVQRIVRRMVRNSSHWEDMESEGIYALIQAIGRYDLSKGGPFEPYAIVCIRGRILEALSKQNGYGVAGNSHRRLRRLRRAVAEIGTNATDEELAKALKLGLRTIRRLRPFVRCVSLDAASGEAGETPLAECALPDFTFWEKPKDAAVKAQEDEDLAILQAALTQLPTRERFVIERRFGILGRDPQSQTNLAGQLGVRRQRISQITARALNRLHALGWKAVCG